MRVAVTLILLAWVGACKGDAVKCDQGCRNFATLVYWKSADAEIAAAPLDQRDALRKRHLGEVEHVIARGIDQCVSQCQAANNPDQIDCMVEAKTADQVIACTK